MPTYLFQNPKTKAVKEIIQMMNEPHVYKDDKGTEWVRLWTVPTASVDGKVDAFSPQSFIAKTGKQRGKLGDLFDQSKELSEKRAKRYGFDPVKKKALEDWGKKRGGRVHPELQNFT